MASLILLITYFSFIILLLVNHTYADDKSNNWFTSLADKVFSLFGDKKESLSVIKPQIPKLIDKLSNEMIESIVVNAKNLLIDGKMEESIDVLLNVIESEPLHLESNTLLGAMLLSLRQYTLAEQFLYTAVNGSNWKDSSAVANLAQVLHLSNDTELALKILARGMIAITQNDTSGVLSACYGDIAYSIANYSIAAEWYLNAANKRPYVIDRWIQASTIQYPSEAIDLKFAENVLLQGLTFNPQNSELMFNLGIVMYNKGLYQEAIVLYEESIRINNEPTTTSTISDNIIDITSGSNMITNDIMNQKNKDIYSALATALHNSASNINRDIPSFRKAWNAYIIAEQLNPTNEVLLANYAILLFEIGQKEESLVIANRALAINSSNKDALNIVKLCNASNIKE